jgi:hypothetical protein
MLQGAEWDQDVVFIGDIHRQWRYVAEGLAKSARKPGVAVLLGDMECDKPLDVAAAPLLDAGMIMMVVRKCGPIWSITSVIHVHATAF